MKPTALTNDITWIGVNDTQTRLFEGLWSIEKEGISYNSYLIKDDKSTLIDLCKDASGDLLIENIRACMDPQQLTYLVINHMEPDHSGAIRSLLEIAPDIIFLGSEKTRAMLAAFFDIHDNVRVVTDGETLALGKHTLRFLSTPMVHWPETIMTYEESSGILFSCDGFGGYGKLEHGIFDDQQPDLPFFEQESLRYFSNIVAAFGKPVLKAAQKITPLDIQMVAPSHGLIWRHDPQYILERYIQWSKMATEPSAQKICILVGSMYGNTAAVLPAIQQSLNEKAFPFECLDVTQTPISYLLPALLTSSGVVVCAPTYEGGLFPTMEFVLEMVDKKRIQNRKAIFIGSYGWGGGAMRFMNQQCEKLHWDMLDSLEFQGQASAQDLAEIQNLTTRLMESL